MRIKKFALLFLSLIMALTSFVFTSCGDGHEHDYQFNCNATNHWQECICGEVKKESEEAHTIKNGECEVCTQTQFTEGLEFTRVVKGDDFVYHVKSYTGSATEVVIPSAVCGKPLTGIAHGAFKNCSAVTSISLPEIITYVGDYAFEGCTSLTYYEKGEIRYLGNEWNNYLYLASSTNTLRTSATIESGCRVIGSGAFKGHTKLATVTIPNSVKCFAKEAFRGCLHGVLTKVNYLGTPDEWAQITFSEASANPVFYCKKLYTNGEKVVNLVLSVPVISEYAFFDCDSIETLTLAEGVTHIGKSAFEAVNTLTGYNGDYTYYFTSLVLPSTLVYIGHSAFRYCANINTLFIPTSVEYIGPYAFANCIKLSKINFGGEMAEWENRHLGTGWNYLAKAVTLQCTNGSLSLEKN